MSLHALAQILVSASALGAALIAPAEADASKDNWIQCENKDGVYSSEQILVACSKIIEARKENDADLAAAFSNRGRAAAIQGNLQSTINDFDQAVKLNNKLSAPFNNRGAAYLSLGDQAKAVADFSEAIRLDPQDAGALMNRANALFGAQEFDRAEADFDRAIKSDPKLANAYLGRGRCALALGSFDRSVKDFDQAIALNPALAAAYRYRGVAKFHQRRMTQAIKDFSDAIRLNRNDAAAFADRGNAFLTLKSFAQAIADYDQALSLSPQAVTTLRNRCLARATWGKELERAVQDCDAAIALYPSPITFSHRGLAQYKREKYHDALADFDNAYQLDPRLVGALFGRGATRIALGQIALGRADISAAKSKDPNVESDYRQLGLKPQCGE